MSNSWTSQTPSSPYGPYWVQALGPSTHPPSLPSSSQWVYNPDALIPPPAPRLDPIPLPPISDDDTILNRLVSYSSRPRIRYDVRHHLGYATCSSGSQHWLDEPATNPPSPEMVIECRFLPRRFVVVPTSRALNYVTIRDLLAATHDAFNEAARDGVVEDENWDSGFSIWSGASNGRFTWAGLSDQTAHRTWLLHIK